MSPRVDPLAEDAAAEERRKCKHPHLAFESSGNRLRCVDCRRYWLSGWVNPTDGFETMMTDFTYRNPEIGDGEFRHSPYEAQRREPIAKKIR